MESSGDGPSRSASTSVTAHGPQGNLWRRAFPLDKHLALRTLTALVGIPILLAAIWWGQVGVFLLVAAFVIVGVREFYRLHPGASTKLPVLLGAAWAFAFVVAAQAAATAGHFLAASAGVLLGGAFLALLWVIAYYRASGPPNHRASGPPNHQDSGWRGIAYLVGGPLYVGFLLAHAVALGGVNDGGTTGRDWLLFAIATTFATDTGAFFVGRSLGRHRLAPNISPGKTWEGAAGGLAAATMGAIVVAQVLGLGPPLWQEALLGAAVGGNVPVGRSTGIPAEAHFPSQGHG